MIETLPGHAKLILGRNWVPKHRTILNFHDSLDMFEKSGANIVTGLAPQVGAYRETDESVTILHNLFLEKYLERAKTSG